MIYLDNCATTKIREEVLEKMYESLKHDFANPSSLHDLGINSEKKIKEAREIISKFMDVRPSELYFTSGGTESNNIAIQSVVNKYSNRGKHLITTEIEHPSVLNVMKYLETKGYSVTYLKVDGNGLIDLSQLEDSITDETILISIIHVNNEIGSIQDIKKIRQIIDNKNKHTILHLDGIQSFGKIYFNLNDLGVDLFSFSGHKIYGPKGIGGLFIKDSLNLDPITFGGGQESGMRSGTENLTGIIGIGEAIRLIDKNQKADIEYVSSLKKHMVEKIKENIEDIKINSPLDETGSPYILNVSFKNTRGEVLLHYLEDKKIYISTTSACSSKGTEKSHVLKAIDLEDEYIEGAIRMCFSYDIGREDLDYVVEVLKSSVEEIRKIIMR